jgi:hypothetical protein
VNTGEEQQQRRRSGAKQGLAKTEASGEQEGVSSA